MYSALSNKLRGLLGASAFTLCAVAGCSNQEPSDEQPSKTGKEKKGDAQASGEDEGGDLNDLVGLSDAKEREARCLKLGKKIYAKHGIKAKQEVVECEEEGGSSFQMDVLELSDFCEEVGEFNELDKWNCSVTYAQLAWCFEGVGECSPSKEQFCFFRMEMCSDDIAPKTKQSEKTLKKNARHLSTFSDSEVQELCEESLETDFKAKGVEPGDKYECEGSSKEIEVVDHKEVCKAVSGTFNLKAELCDMRVGDLMGCFSVESQCNEDLQHFCKIVISGCSEE